jgi:hypothetical protein
MQIKSVTRLQTPQHLVESERCDHVIVTIEPGSDIPSLWWPYETSFKGPQATAKRHGGRWDPSAQEWTFSDSKSAYKVLASIKKRHPEWPVLGDPDKPYMPLAGVKISRVDLGRGLAAFLLPTPIPRFTDMPEDLQAFVLESDSSNREHDIGMLLGCSADADEAQELLCEQGAMLNDGLSKKVRFELNSTVQVIAFDWPVHLQCALTNPHHYCLIPAPEEWSRRYDGVVTPWRGVVHTTRKKWPEWKTKLADNKIEWEGDDPDQAVSPPFAFDADSVPGWVAPAPNGHLLHAYQKNGVQFCLARGMRAMIGDEMGIGKTAQAIAAAEASGAQRVVIFCPANARYVWEREIKGWSGRGDVQHIKTQFDKPDLNCRWHIVTYDLLGVRPFSWTFRDDQEMATLLQVCPRLSDQIKEIKQGGKKVHKLSFDEPLDTVPAFADLNRAETWIKEMQRLRERREHGVLAQLLTLDQPTVVADEAHRAKNREAKRTKALRQIAQHVPYILLLTGTPLRNNEHEAAVLLGLLDEGAAKALPQDKGYTIDDVKDYLSHLMVRRTKAEVLPELPAKTRQRIDLDDLAPMHLNDYRDALESALAAYDKALSRGKSEAEAQQEMQGGIERARTKLGLAKVMGSGVLETVLEVIENKGCCVVFCAHHNVSDGLQERLTQHNIRASVIDGRVKPEHRAEIVDNFQKGSIDVIIGGINAAGEAITLTRADTVIFVELDWVPAALLQAEDRIHRVGQKSNCQVIQLIAKLPPVVFNLDDMMVELLGSKRALIGAVLEEDTENIISANMKSAVQQRLLSSWQPTTINAPAASTSSDADLVPVPVETPSPATEQAPTQRKRGRPKKYSDAAPPPSATDRSKHSIKALTERGGRRVMLRLEGEANAALEAIMALTGADETTATINQAIIEWHRHLLQASTKNQE